MTVDEDIAFIAAGRPAELKRWSDWQDAVNSADARLESAELTPDQAPAVRACLLTSEQNLRGARFAYFRFCLRVQDHAALCSFVYRVSYATPSYQTLGHAAEQGDDVWPVLWGLLEQKRHDAEELARFLIRQDADEPRVRAQFAELARRDAPFAARVSRSVSTFEHSGFVRIQDIIVALALHADPRVGKDAAVALKAGAGLAPLTRVAELCARLDDAQQASELAHALAMSATSTQDTALLSLLRTHPSTVVRTATLGVDLLSDTPWQHVMRALTDSEPAVQNKALLSLYSARLAVSIDDLLTLIPGPSADGVLAFLSFAVLQTPALKEQLVGRLPKQLSSKLLSPKPTLACSTCRTLTRLRSWNQGAHTPSEAAALRVVAAVDPAPVTSADEVKEELRQCNCGAYYLFHYDCERDVNSFHESYSIRRIPKAELLADYAVHVDFAHPRFVRWDEAVLNDLEHIDPYWRREATWERTRNLRAAGDFVTIEESLLHHPDTEVVLAALSEILSYGSLKLHLSEPTLEMLVQHPNEQVQTKAVTLLTYIHGGHTFRFRTGAHGEAEALAIDLAIRRGKVKPTAKLGSEAVALALREGPFNACAAVAKACGFGTAQDHERIWRACSNTDPVVRANAFALTHAMPLELKKGAMPLVLEAQHIAPIECAFAACVISQSGAPLAPAIPVIINAINRMQPTRAESLTSFVRMAWERGHDVSPLITPLCEICERARNAYSLMSFIEAWAKKHPLSAEARASLTRVAAESSGSCRESALRALAT